MADERPADTSLDAATAAPGGPAVGGSSSGQTEQAPGDSSKPQGEAPDLAAGGAAARAEPGPPPPAANQPSAQPVAPSDGEGTAPGQPLTADSRALQIEKAKVGSADPQRRPPGDAPSTGMSGAVGAAPGSSGGPAEPVAPGAPGGTPGGNHGVSETNPDPLPGSSQTATPHPEALLRTSVSMDESSISGRARTTGLADDLVADEQPFSTPAVTVSGTGGHRPAEPPPAPDHAGGVALPGDPGRVGPAGGPPVDVEQPDGAVPGVTQPVPTSTDQRVAGSRERTPGQTVAGPHRPSAPDGEVSAG